LLGFGFHSLNLHRIFLRVHADNARGIRAYEKCGFQHEGCQREAVFKSGRYYDELRMAVLDHEFGQERSIP
ncbi:MAG: GNAT family N-acetyltransferase, partial [Anaerolineae bacterium]|nr:GNAT family N-acetyltransferase [Anaerolineae bacterium]